MSPDREADLDALERELRAAFAELAPRLPDIEPGDLLLILECLLRPPGSGRRFLLRGLGAGIYVP